MKPTAGIACLNRRKFDGDWDQVEYCRRKVLFWYYARRNRHHARRFCRVLKELLIKVANRHEAILGEECWSLFYEVEGDLGLAIQYRRSEIRLIKRLRRMKLEFEDYGADDFADRYVLLALLCMEANRIGEAVLALRAAKRICTRNRIEFDSNRLLQSYESLLRRQNLPQKSRVNKDGGRRSGSRL